MFDWLTDAVSGGIVGYLVVLAAAAGDVVIPIVPSETILITAGILAAKGTMSIWLVIPAAAAGAVLGDNISYWLGRRFGARIARRVFRSDEGRARLAWAQSAIHRRGIVLVIMGRFIPGGRTASTFAAGTLEMRYARFFAADVCAGLIWAVYAALLGYVGGATFEGSTWKPFASSIGVAVLLGLCIELWRRVQLRRGRDIFGDAVD
jgi:membrane-associated protein